MKKMFAMLCSLCICFFFSTEVYAQGENERSAVVCPRCSAPTVISSEDEMRFLGYVPCPKVQGEFDMKYETVRCDYIYCAAGCGYNSYTERHSSYFVPCDH